MSFISGALDKSVFNKGSYAAAIGKTDDKGIFDNGYAVVKIQPSSKQFDRSGRKGLAIRGVMDYSQGGLSFSVPSTWRDLQGVGGSILPGATGKIKDLMDNKVNPIANIGGFADVGAAFASKLIYQQSGYLEISIPMMVVDWQGTGQPLMTSIMLAYYCLPQPVGNLSDLMESINTYLDNQIEKMEGSESLKTQIAGLGVGAVKHIGEGIVKMVKDLSEKGSDWVDNKTGTTGVGAMLVDSGKELVSEAVDDFTTLRSSPVPVEVEIGQFFRRSDMVIKNLQYTFSKEMTKMGPLYVKFNLELSSRKIMVSPQETGLFLKGDQSRFMEANFTGK